MTGFLPGKVRKITWFRLFCQSKWVMHLTAVWQHSGRKIQSVFNVHLERLARGVFENIKKKQTWMGLSRLKLFVLHLKLYLCLSLFSQKELLSIHKFPEFSIFLYNMVIKNADVAVQGKNSTSLSDCLSVFHLKKHSLILDTNSVQKLLSFPSI